LLSDKWSAHLVAGIKDENGTSDGLLANTLPDHFHLDRPEIHGNGELFTTLSGSR